MEKTRARTHLTAVAIVVCALFLGTAGSAYAQTTGTLTINATVAARAQLTLTPTTITFPDANPGTTPSIPANQTVSVTASVRTSGTPTLKVLANGDLTSGTDTIPINNVTWTASAAPFIAGTMNKTTAQDGATWTASQAGSWTGIYTYYLANSWNYKVGSYTQTVTYTLTAP